MPDVVDDANIELLKKMLSLSREQEAFIKDGRLAAALELMKRRDGLVDEMKASGFVIGESDAGARAVLADIAESDSRIRMLTEGLLKEVSDKLKARLNAKSVISAYMESGQ